MNSTKKTLHKRLAQYGMLTAAIAATNDADAAVIYTDETPDFAGGNGSQYFLDLDNNGVDDFRIWHNSSSNLYISPLAATNEVLGSGGATFAYPFALNSGAVISSGAGQFFNNGFSGGFQSLNYGSCSFGNWCNVTDRFIGLRFDISGTIHYGWVRLDVDYAGNSWTVKDYAYETNGGAGINAGDVGGVGVVASQATAISGLDVANSSNETDLEFSFDAAVDETTISEYRVIIVKSALVGTFDITAAEALPMANYTAVTPNGGPTYTQVLTTGAIDSDGDAIVIGQAYRIYVLNVADGTNATINSLSVATADVTLNTPTLAATGISGSDIGDNGNATDLQADFTAASSEFGILEYRVMAVKSSVAGSFDLAAAQAVPATAYEVQTPNGGPYSFAFNAATTDSDGDAIILGVPYTLFVMSAADGTSANIDSLAFAATDVKLEVITTPVSGAAIVGSDIDDNGNGLDLQVDFDAASSEFGILAYRVIAVKPSSAINFTLNDALNLPSTAWMFVTADGSPSYTTVFEAQKTDSDGDLIVEGQPYSIFVVSFANTQQATLSSMANSQTSVTLISYIGLNENSLNEIGVISANDNITITLPETLLGHNLKAELVNLNGQVVEGINATDATNTMNTNDITTGVYFLQIKDADATLKSFKVFVK
ncbi:T9SS type A sorting domain-containing protein [Crocinitomicaceae bacterium]|nr:T9SS type A sorting domain-containing protein [Crocinitomicaceae bacterium]